MNFPRSATKRWVWATGLLFGFGCPGFELPPMGMHTFYASPGPVSEVFVLAQFDSMATNGWQAAGYNLVIIDDTWQGTRDKNGVLQPDPVAFPHGIKWLADAAHARGLKLGLYTEPTLRTSAGRIGSEGHLALDARTFTEWGIDFIKFDMGLIAPDQLHWRPERDTAEFASALHAAGWRGHLHLGLGLAPYGPWVHLWGKSWRASHGVPPGDLYSPGVGVDISAGSAFIAKVQVLRNWDRMMEHAANYGPGKWTSFDSIPSSFAAANPAAFRFCVSLFSMGGVDLLCHNFRAPGDANYPLSKALLTGEWLRINQDPLCSPPVRIQSNNLPAVYGTPQGWEIWKRQLGAERGAWQALLLINRDEKSAATIQLDWLAMGHEAGTPLCFVDIESGMVETATDKQVVVPPFSTVMFKAARADQAQPFAPRILQWRVGASGTLALTASCLPNRTVALLNGTNCVFPVHWNPVATNCADAGGTVQFISQTPEDSRGFYRLETR